MKSKIPMNTPVMAFLTLICGMVLSNSSLPRLLQAQEQKLVKAPLRRGVIQHLVQSAYFDGMMREEREISIREKTYVMLFEKNFWKLQEKIDGDDEDANIRPDTFKIAPPGSILTIKVEKEKFHLACFPDKLGRFFYFPADMVLAKAGPHTLRFIDVNCNGFYFDEGVDMVIASEKGMFAFLFYREIPLSDEIYIFSPGEDRGKVSLEYTTRPFVTKEKARKLQQSLNQVRMDFGLFPVVSDAEWNQHCAAHCQYCDINNFRGHEEEPGKPGYSEKGHAAGMSSILHFTGDPHAAVFSLFDTPLHGWVIRSPWYTQGAYGASNGTCAIRVYGWKYREMAMPVPYIFPPNNAQGIPVSWRNENPNPRVEPGRGNGYPITIYPEWAKDTVPTTMAVVVSEYTPRTRQWTEVPCQLTYNKDTASAELKSRGFTKIFVLPYDKLKSNTLYKVEAEWEVNKKKGSLQSCFQTGGGEGQNPWNTTQEP